MKKKLQGFTLVELLVVIAIITMLLAIMLPILSRSRLLGNRITCLNNLRQLGIAVETYAMSCKYYPVCVSDVNEKWSDFMANKSIANGKMLGVPVSLWPFHQNANLYNCPILKKAGADISYCYNYNAGKKYEAYESAVGPSYLPKEEPGPEKTKVVLLTPEQVKTPAMFVLLYDVPLEPKQIVEDLYKDIDPDDYAVSDIDEEGFLAGIYVGPHSKASDILFADGHSKWHKKWSGSEMNRSPK